MRRAAAQAPLAHLAPASAPGTPRWRRARQRSEHARMCARSGRTAARAAKCAARAAARAAFVASCKDCAEAAAAPDVRLPVGQARRCDRRGPPPLRPSPATAMPAVDAPGARLDSPFGPTAPAVVRAAPHHATLRRAPLPPPRRPDAGIQAAVQQAAAVFYTAARHAAVWRPPSAGNPWGPLEVACRTPGRCMGWTASSA